MLSFILRRCGVALLTALCLTFIVFYLVNLDPNLEKLAKSLGNQRMTDEQVEVFLQENGYRQPLLSRYGEWLGVIPGWTGTKDNGQPRGRCVKPDVSPEDTPAYCGVLQGNWGFLPSIKRKQVV